MTLHTFFLVRSYRTAHVYRSITRACNSTHCTCETRTLHESAYKELHTFTFTQWKGMQFPRITGSAAIHASDTVDIAVNECLDLSTSHTVM